jgi:hypothetical protein
MPNVSRVVRATKHRLERWRSARREARAVWRKVWVVYSGVAALACGASACGAPARDADAGNSPATAATGSMHEGAAARTLDVAPAASVAAAAHSFGTELGFRSPQRLDEHFAKHGGEFGGITREEYLRQAQALRDAPVSPSLLEVRRDDGVVSRFDRRTGAFLAFDADGIIRTFFRPNDGEAYFRRQARRRPNP